MGSQRHEAPVCNVIPDDESEGTRAQPYRSFFRHMLSAMTVRESLRNDYFYLPGYE
jgi:hypothetical protein